MTTADLQKKIILLANPGKSHTIKVARELVPWLSQRVRIVAHNLESHLDIENIPAADFIVVLGGDGSILNTVRTLGAQQIPLIGVNMGKLGFLAEFSIRQFKDQFIRIVSDEKLISKRFMLHCRIVGPNRSEFVTTAVNEVAIIAGPPFRMIEVSVKIAGENLALCAGDGLIVATPTGSTAYNLSAGGPILASTIRAAVITPLAAHSLSFRPIVVDMGKPIVLQACDVSHQTMDNDNKNEAAVAVIDGQLNTPLNNEDELIITRAQANFQLVQNPQRSQWQLLNTKLNWGALPNYDHPGQEQ